MEFGGFFLQRAIDALFLFVIFVFLQVDNFFSSKYRGYRRLFVLAIISGIYYIILDDSKEVKSALWCLSFIEFVFIMACKLTYIKRDYCFAVFLLLMLFSSAATGRVFAGAIIVLPCLNLLAMFFSISPMSWWEFLIPIDTMRLTIQEKDKLVDPFWVFYDETNNQRDIGSNIKINTNIIKSKKNSFLDASYMKLQSPEKLSKALTNIKKRDGGFSYEAFLKRVTPVCKRIYNAVNSNNIEIIDYMLSDALAEQLRYFASSEISGPVSADFVINDMRIAQVNSSANFDILHLFVRAVSYDYITEKDLEEEELIDEIANYSKKLIERNVTEYYTFVRRPSAKTLERPGLLEGKCPNCGSPIKIGEHTVCKSCGSFIRSGEYDWVLAKITPAKYWDYIEPDSIYGYNELCQSDPDFTVQQIEDKSGVLYWLLERAKEDRNPKYIKRFATANFCNSFTRMACSQYIEPMICRSVNLTAIDTTEDKDRCYVLVKYVIEGIVNNKGNELVSQWVYVLSRNKGKKTRINRALSSVHCPNCGAPLNSSFAENCEYCGAIVNDGNEWALEKMITPDDQTYCNLIEKAKEALKKTTKFDFEYLESNDTLAVSAQILMADGKMEDSEYELLLTIAKQSGVSERQLKRILDNMKAGSVHVPLPKGGIKAENVIRAATRMAFADRELADEEMEAIVNMGYQMGYSKLDIRRIMNSEMAKLHKEGETIIRTSSKESVNGDQNSFGSGEDIAKLSDAELKSREQESYDIISAAVQIMLADGLMDKRELEYLRSLSQSLNIPYSTVNEIIDNVKSGISYIPTPEFGSPKAERILRAAVKMSLVDDIFNERENQILIKIAEKMGYSKLDVNRLLNSERNLKEKKPEAIAESEAYEKERKERIEKEKRRALQSRPIAKG